MLQPDIVQNSEYSVLKVNGLRTCKDAVNSRCGIVRSACASVELALCSEQQKRMNQAAMILKMR